ncbi:MAG: DUF1552 domain-containing protein [Nannocystaceae bacterium]
MIIVRSRALSRRRFLRGTVAGGLSCAVGLPLLDAMLDRHGTALASGEALPLRLGSWMFGNGMPPEEWTPAEVGPNWTPKACMAAFADPIIKPYVSVISGTDLGVGFGDHITSRAVAFSGSTTGVQAGQADAATTMPSIDQLAADVLGATTSFRSVELGVSKASYMGAGADEFSVAMRDGQLLPAEFSPLSLYNRLFLGFQPDTRVLDTRLGVIDAVRADAQELQARLGAADRQRLEAHLQGLSELQTRLQSEPPTCSPPMAPVDPQDNGANEPLSARSQLLCDVLAQALACDLVRVFSMRFNQAISDTVVWEAGITEGLHTITHDPGKRGMYVSAVAFSMEQLAYLLSALAAIPEGEGNVLDRCAIYCSSDLADGQQHTVTDYPVIVAGRAGGALRSGDHIATGGKKTSVVPLTLLQAVGVPTTMFGDASYGASEPLAELLA